MRGKLASLLMMMSAAGCAVSTSGNSAFCDLGPYRYPAIGTNVDADRFGDSYNATFEKVCE